MIVNLPRAMRKFVEQQTSPNTRRSYERDLKVWCLWQIGKPFTVDTAVDFKTHLVSTYAPATAQRTFSTVRTFYQWMFDRGETDANPFAHVKSPSHSETAPVVPTDLDVARILKTVDRWDGLRGGRGARDYAILTLLLNGLRAQEVCDLRWKDLSFTMGAWCLRVVGKGNKERFVPLSHEAAEALHYYMDHTFKPGVRDRGEQDQPLFTDIIGQPVTRDQIRHVCEKYGEAAGIKGFLPHSFRHHYGTRMYRATRDVLGVGKLMGHARPETTMRYARLDLADIIETAKLDPRNPVDEVEYNAKQA